MRNKVQLLYPELSYRLQGCFFKVYNILGFGHKEIAYQRALEQELTLQHIPFQREVHLSITYKEKKIAEYVPDLVIDEKIIVETKALEFLPNKFIAQLVNYLKGTNFQLGYLVNFGAPKLQIIRRIWTPNYKNRMTTNNSELTRNKYGQA